MSVSQKKVVIGDSDLKSFNWLKERLLDQFATDAVQATSFAHVKEIIRNQPDSFRDSVILLTDDLPLSAVIPRKDPQTNFVKLEEFLESTAVYNVELVCLITKENTPTLDGCIKEPLLIELRTLTKETAHSVTEQLRTISFFRKRATESKVVEIDWNHANRSLSRQIRSLSEHHDLRDGRTQLQRLIRSCIDCRDAQKIVINQLGQGRSGASVFHLTVTKDGRPKDYVLKLSTELWKLESEVRGHIKAATNAGLPGYKTHVARLLPPKPVLLPTNDDEDRFIVSNGKWYAIHYDFLGGQTFGSFLDLETALIGNPAGLIDKTSSANAEYRLTSTDPASVLSYRLRIFEEILNGLCDIWYGKKELRTRKIEETWNLKNAPDREFVPLPPYQLTRRARGWVEDFLDSREAAVGERMFDDWHEHKDRVLKLVSSPPGKKNALGRLADKIAFTYSPVHGDLNVNNVLLWLKSSRHPFIIDLPFYQEVGHMMQDFARLEVEIKFALMDRQEESPEDLLRAFDNTFSQVPLWVELEKQLLKNEALSESELSTLKPADYLWIENGFTENVALSFQLIVFIREKACAIQQSEISSTVKKASFRAEYLPALLYHTVRSIGYPSLSVFKRLLAVYSAGSILKEIS